MKRIRRLSTIFVDKGKFSQRELTDLLESISVNSQKELVKVTTTALYDGGLAYTVEYDDVE